MFKRSYAAAACLTILLLCSSRTEAGEQTRPEKESSFYTGSNGSIATWLARGPYTTPQADLESNAGLQAMPICKIPAGNPNLFNTDSRDWRYVNSGSAPTVLQMTNPMKAGEGYYYCKVNIKPGMDFDGVVVLNSFSPSRLWLNDSPPTDSRKTDPQNPTFLNHAPLRFKNGNSVTCNVRLDSRTAPPVFVLFVLKSNPDGGYLSATHVQSVITFSAPADFYPPASPTPLKLSSSNRFVDGLQKISLTLSGDPAGIIASDKPYSVMVSSLPELGAKDIVPDIKIENLSSFISEGITFDIPLPADIKASKITLKAALAINVTPVCSGTTDLFIEQNLLSRYAKIKGQIAGLPESESTGVAMARLSMEQINLLTDGRQRRTLFYGEQFDSALSRAEDGINAFATGADPLKDKTGVIEAAYISDIDGSVQPYRYYIPKSVKTGKKMPLIVLLHGYVTSYNKLNWFALDEKMTPAFEELGSALLVPFGRSCTDFLTIGEVDVLKTIDEVSKRHAIDKDRVYLVGYSMGGSGVWTMLSHYPDRFAAAQVWSGRTDYYFWHAEKFERALVSKETMPFYKRVLINADNPYDLAATLKDIPIKTFHAEDDQLIKPGHSSRIFSLLSPPKGKMQLIKIPPNNGGHWFFQYQLGDPEAYRWMLNHKIESPDVIEHICYSPKYGKKHWLSIESMIKPNVPAHVKARIDREKKTVVIETADNIFSLFFHNRIMLTLDNFKIVLSPDAAENRTRQLVLLDMATGTLAIIKNEKKPDAKARAPKFALQSGSVKEAFNHPFMLVVGTGGSEQEKETNLGNADRFIADWKVFAHAMPRVKNDSEITNADEKAFNLILFGSPESNSCLARYSAALPYKFLKTGYQIGENKVEGDGLGFCGIYPNPNNGARAVVIIDGLYYGQSLSFNHKWDLVPDFIIFDSRIDEYDGTNTARLAGFFDSSWQVSPELIYKPED